MPLLFRRLPLPSAVSTIWHWLLQERGWVLGNVPFGVRLESITWDGTSLEIRLITIFLNGQARQVPEGLTLAALLEWLKLPADRVAVERNLEITPKARWDETRVQANDRLEVVHFVGGGSRQA